jgi:hypothetical protein
MRARGAEACDPLLKGNMVMPHSRSRGALALTLVLVGIALCAVFGTLLWNEGIRLDEASALEPDTSALPFLFIGAGGGLLITALGAVLGFRAIGLELSRRSAT